MTRRLPRRDFIRTTAGLYVAVSAPILVGGNCSPSDVDAIIKLIELALQITDRVLGSLETKTRSSGVASEFVYERLYRAKGDGMPEGEAIGEHKYVVATPPDGQWHETPLQGFTIANEGDYVVVADGTTISATSDTVRVRS